MIRIPLMLVALAILAGCDPIRFAVKNDTGEPVKIVHRFDKANTNCHTPEFMGGEGSIAAANNIAFACPASEISYIELTQNGQSCRVTKRDLVTMNNELKASVCLTNARFSNARSPS